jgi:hypothetical protein
MTEKAATVLAVTEEDDKGAVFAGALKLRGGVTPPPEVRFGDSLERGANPSDGDAFKEVPNTIELGTVRPFNLYFSFQICLISATLSYLRCSPKCFSYFNTS